MLRIVCILLISMMFSSMVLAKLKVGDTPPDYLGKSVIGEDINVSDYKGQVVIAAFWASWCAYCLEELPVLETIQRELGVDKIKVVAVNYNERKREFDKLYRKISDYELLVTKGTNSVITSYKVVALPFMVIIGKDGTIAHIHTGYDKKILPELAEQINAEVFGVSYIEP